MEPEHGDAISESSSDTNCWDKVDPTRRIPEITVRKVLELRMTYHLGPQRIAWYMDRYHDTRISFSSVYRILVRNGVNRLPKQVGRRALHTRR